MGQIQRALAEIRGYLGKLSTTQQLLIASTVVIALMALFLVTQYAGGPTLVPLGGIAPEDQPRVVNSLQLANFRATMRDGSVMVPEGSQQDAIAHLSESGICPTTRPSSLTTW
jgi:flagellar biosynthesis/type III secretory pathway M-ring protein FliF/YscJ